MSALVSLSEISNVSVFDIPGNLIISVTCEYHLKVYYRESGSTAKLSPVRCVNEMCTMHYLSEARIMLEQNRSDDLISDNCGPFSLFFCHTGLTG